MVCLSRSYHVKYFKGCLPRILLGPFLSTLSQITLQAVAGILGYQLLVISTLGSKGRVRISPKPAIPLCCVTLGHFSGVDRTNYVAMRPQSGMLF